MDFNLYTCVCIALLFLEFLSNLLSNDNFPEDREDMPKDEFLKSNKNRYIYQYVKAYYKYVYLKSIYSASGLYILKHYFIYRVSLFMFMDSWNILYLMPYIYLYKLIIVSALNAVVNIVMYYLLMCKHKSLSAHFLFIRYAYPDKSIMDPPSPPSTIIIFGFPILCNVIPYHKTKMKRPSWYPLKAMKGSIPETYR